MPSITVEAPNEEIDITVYLDDYLSEIDIDLDDEQVQECIDDNPHMVIHYLWESHTDVIRQFVKDMDAGERMNLFAGGEKTDKKTSEDGITVYVNGDKEAVNV